ncbi:MAG: cyclic nucleotide-binding domain-containing protein [Luteitalea sp.]|nr:cyclic nucleotide-binding domain-containing protein [Luteitalea sp.]
MGPRLPDVLQTAPVFRKLKAEDRERVAAVAKLADYKRGEVIFREGDPSNRFYMVVTGRVKVFKVTPSGQDLILEIFGPGDPLGAVAVYEGIPFPASAVALESVTCVTIGNEDFFLLLECYPTLVRGLLLGLTQRLVELTTRLAQLTGGRVEPRFARLFLKLASKMGRGERGGIFIPLSLSRRELADLAGTTIETTIRIVSRWGKDQVVRTEKDGFVVLNREALRVLAFTGSSPCARLPERPPQMTTAIGREAGCRP